MYLYATITDPAIILRDACLPPPLGPGFSRELAMTLTKLEVWSTSSDTDDDFNEFRAFNAAGLVAAVHLPGY
jgi:hypothetical protein